MSFPVDFGSTLNSPRTPAQAFLALNHESRGDITAVSSHLLDVSGFFNHFVNLYFEECQRNRRSHVSKSVLQLKYKTAANAAFKQNLTSSLLERYLYDSEAGPTVCLQLAPRTLNRAEFNRMCQKYNKQEARSITLEDLKY
ncbi:hypothetical protein P9112_013048 [Eukaryota sp. TZLM1-RC]